MILGFKLLHREMAMGLDVLISKVEIKSMVKQPLKHPYSRTFTDY